MTTTKKAPEPEPKATPKAAKVADPVTRPDPVRTGPPFIVNGIDPASGRNPDVDDRMRWLEKQQAAMKAGR